MALLKPVDGPGELHGRRKLEVFNPATLEKNGEIVVATASGVQQAVTAARAAQESWAALGFGERSRLMLKVRDALIGGVDSLIEVICNDTGKPRIEVLAGEVSGSCEALTFYARHARRLLGSRRERRHPLESVKLVRSYGPMGVVGAITPWNFPLLLSVAPTVQALMAGNAVVLKPSEVTPFVGLALEEVFRAAEVPEGVFQVVSGDASTGAALVQSGCDMISFAGSARTGRAVAEACAQRLIPCVLELTGKNPMILCEDADLERASRYAVSGAFANSGQICTSIERVYVVEKVAQPFVDRVVALTRRLRQGPETLGEIDVGSLTLPDQLDVLERHVKDAIDKGARALTGGRRNPAYEGYFYEPTVLVDVDDSMQVMHEETFGPMLPIQVVKDEDEALQLVGGDSYALQVSLWTRSGYRARQLADRVPVGRVTVNDVSSSHSMFASPVVGIKQSGIDRGNAESGLKRYTRVQSVLQPRFPFRGDGLSYPYGSGALRAHERMLRVFYRSPIGRLLGK